MSYTPTFVACAAPQAIEYHINKARRKRSEAERDLQFLEALLAERNEQIAAGTWPPQREKLDRG